MCGADARFFAIGGVISNAQDKYRSRFPMGVYGDNMIAHQKKLDISSDPNEGSHSWAMSK